MAKIAYSAIVNDVRGKMGTDVFSSSHYGPTARIKASPKNRKTAAQRFVRGNLSKAAKAFEGLSPTQRTAWNNYAATVIRHNPVTGQSTPATAVDAFIELAAKFLQVSPSGTIPLTPPAGDFTGDTITLTATAGTGQITFTASGANALGVTTELLLQPLPSLNRVPSPKAYRHAAFKVFIGGGLTQVVNVPAGYFAAGYRFVKTATGQATEMVELPVQTVALSLEVGGSAEQAAEAPASKKKAA